MSTKRWGPYCCHADSRLKLELMEKKNVAESETVQEPLYQASTINMSLLPPKKRSSRESQKSTVSSPKRSKYG
jgi:hypothetical protein